ncbi:MAG: phosphoenolpyruvate mutase [Alphaproteobacteria bacterium]|nr:phosphoenolpyruvate mutase [Alphaproteobacteria bacterium]
MNRTGSAKTAQNVTRLALKRNATAEASPQAKFRALLTEPELSFIMEAHNGLSAKIVEEAGFKGIWASGLSMSAALGVRDSNEASWTQVLEMLEFMADATSLPIMLDGDTGYGNFNNFRRLVKKLDQRNIAAVCIEDKLFPKTNSFIGDFQPLADTDEFCGKIKAGKDVQNDPDFSIVARVEALIAGHGIDEAITRAHAYVEAGADGVLIHSKKSGPDEILSFMAAWDGAAPVVIVPTMYYATPTDAFREANVSMVIWANHNLRAAMTAMRDVSRRIFEEESLTGVEDKIVPVRDIFQIAGNQELADAEKRYLAVDAGSMRAVVLAASRGSGLDELTETMPKCMLDIRGKPLLHRLVDTLNQSGVRDITVVRGYKKEAVAVAQVKTIDNDDYATTGEIASLARARSVLEDSCIICYGDIMLRGHILDQLLEEQGDIVMVVDSYWTQRADIVSAARGDLAVCSEPFTGDYLEGKTITLEALSRDIELADAHGRWIGLAKCTAEGAKEIADEITAMEKEDMAATASMATLMSRLIARGVRPRVIYVSGNWLDVNTAYDLANARNF